MITEIHGAVYQRQAIPRVYAQRPKRYLVPGIPATQKLRTAAIGYFDTGVLRSVRTGKGRRYGEDEIALLICILDEAKQDGFDELEVVINYCRKKLEITYSTTITYLHDHGRRVLGISGWELSMPRCMWSIAGAAPGNQLQPKSNTMATQPALFEFVEPQRGRAYQ